MTETAALGLKVTPDGFDATNVILGDFIKKTDQASDSADKLSGKMRDSKGRFIGAGKGAEEAAKGVDQLGNKIGKTTGLANMLAANLGKLTGIMAGAFSIGAAGRMADDWSDMQSKVGAAVKDMEAAPAIMMRLVEMSNATYSSLDQTVGAFSGNIGAFRDMGRSAEDAMNYTEALNHALVITATKGEQAASVQMHLAKAMDLGKLSGEGLDAVLANGGRVAEALAKELNTNVGSLRKFSSEGKITSHVIANALTKELENLRKEAGEMPATMADGFTRIGTGLTSVIGIFDQITGASGTVANGLIAVGDGLYNLSQWAFSNGDTVLQVVNGIASAAIGAGVAYASTFVPGLIASGIAAVQATGAFILMNGGIWGSVAALVAFRGALVATGIGAIAVAVGVLAFEFLELARKVGGFGTALGLIKAVGVEVFGRLGSVAIFLWNTMKGVALGIQGAFLNAFKGIGAAWDIVANGIASTWNMMADTRAGQMMGLGALDKSNVGGLMGEAAAARYRESAAAFAAARQNIADAVAPLQSLAALQEAVAKGTASVTDETKKLNDETTNTPKKLNDIGGAAKKASKDVDDFTKVMKGLNDELAFLQATQGMSDLEKAIYGKQQEAGVKPGSIGGIAIDEAMRTVDALKRVEDAGKRGAEAVSGIFTSMLDGSKKLKQGIADLLMEMAKVQMQRAVLGLAGSGGFLGSAFSWLGGMLTPNAKGGVYDSPGLSAYSGSVVSSPTVFPFAKGAGLMGEAGPEAILPLKRGADGKLGVDAGGNAGGGHVTIGFDQTTGSLTAYFKTVAGEVVSQASAKIISGAVKSVRAETKRGN